MVEHIGKKTLSDDLDVRDMGLLNQCKLFVASGLPNVDFFVPKQF